MIQRWKQLSDNRKAWINSQYRKRKPNMKTTLFEYNNQTYSFSLFYHVLRYFIRSSMNGITLTSKMKQMASLNVIENNRNLRGLQKNFYFPGQSHIYKVYPAISFRCAEERHALCNKYVNATLSVWHYKKKKKYLRNIFYNTERYHFLHPQCYNYAAHIWSDTISQYDLRGRRERMNMSIVIIKRGFHIGSMLGIEVESFDC